MYCFSYPQGVSWNQINFYSFYKNLLSRNKLNITECERQGILEIIEKIAYCHSEKEYNNLYIEFLRACPNKALQKYDTNWQAINEQFVQLIKKKASGNPEPRWRSFPVLLNCVLIFPLRFKKVAIYLQVSYKFNILSIYIFLS